jgi:hypothetical protein
MLSVSIFGTVASSDRLKSIHSPEMLNFRKALAKKAILENEKDPHASIHHLYSTAVSALHMELLTAKEVYKEFVDPSNGNKGYNSSNRVERQNRCRVAILEKTLEVIDKEYDGFLNFIDKDHS